MSDRPPAGDSTAHCAPPEIAPRSPIRDGVPEEARRSWLRRRLARLSEFLAVLTRLLWAAAVPLMAWAFATLFLLWPPQTVDLLADATWLQTVSYHFAVAIWAVSCWFWARWCLNLEPVSYPEKLRDTEPPAPGENWRGIAVRIHRQPSSTLSLKPLDSRSGGRPFLANSTRIIAQPGQFLRNWIARFPLLASPFIAIIPLIRGGDHVWLQFAIFALVDWPIVIVVANRDLAAKRFTRLLKDKADRWNEHTGSGLLTLGECLTRLPFGPYSWLCWVFAYLVLCLLLLWDQVFIPRQIGAPASSILGMSAATGILTFTSVLIRRCLGLPGLAVVIGWAVLMASQSDNHQIRTIDKDGKRAPVVIGQVDPAVQNRKRLPELLDDWLANCGRDADQPKLVLVATAGGASRAALWTASVMHQIERQVSARQLRQALFSIRGVSGGSLGAAAYVASLPPNSCDVAAEVAKSTKGGGPGPTSEVAKVEESRWTRIESALSTNFLAPPIAAYFTTDLLARIIGWVLPLSYPDRAAALEKSWEEAFARSWRSTGENDDTPPHAGLLGQAFTTLWGDAPPGERLPLLLFNGTHADSGLPILTAPVMVSRDQFSLALDLLDLTGRDMRVSTAISNSARFPVVTPGGTLTDHYPRKCQPGTDCKTGPNYGGYVMDGGYVENFGADTTRDIVADIDAWSYLINAKRTKEAEGTNRSATKFVPHVLVIQVSSDPTASLSELPRCGAPAPDVLRLRTLEKPTQALSDILGPLVTVVDARGARGARTAGDLMRRKCPLPGTSGPVEYVHFALCDQLIKGRVADDVIGLSWTLTPDARSFLSGGPPDSRDERSSAAVDTTTEPAATAGTAITDDPSKPPGAAGSSAIESCANDEEMQKLKAWFAQPWPRRGN